MKNDKKQTFFLDSHQKSQTFGKEKGLVLKKENNFKL